MEAYTSGSGKTFPRSSKKTNITEKSDRKRHNNQYTQPYNRIRAWDDIFFNEEKHQEYLDKEVMDEIEVYNSLTNNFSAAMKRVWAWKKMTYKELSEIILVDARTISRIVNGQQDPKLETLVLICLGLRLPPLISGFLIEKSPCSLDYKNLDHVWYNFALTYLAKRPMPAVRGFLKLHGVSL